MSTPTTDEVREAYQMTGEGLDFKRAATERGVDFDVWLRSVEREQIDKAIEIAKHNRGTFETIEALRDELERLTKESSDV